MSVFRNLRDMCVNFKEDLENDSKQLFFARFGQSYDDEIANKMQDLAIFSAKRRILNAKLISMGPDRPEPSSEEDTMADYEDTAMWKVMEQKTVNSVNQFHDVKVLITTPDSKLELEQRKRKEEINKNLKKIKTVMEQQRIADAMLKQAEDERSVLRVQWDQELCEIIDKKQATTEETVEEGPLYGLLQALTQKMKMMRLLISRLAAARTGYDWLTDSDRRLQALKIARKPHTGHSYTS